MKSKEISWSEKTGLAQNAVRVFFLLIIMIDGHAVVADTPSLRERVVEDLLDQGLEKDLLA